MTENPVISITDELYQKIIFISKLLYSRITWNLSFGKDCSDFSPLSAGVDHMCKNNKSCYEQIQAQPNISSLLLV